MDDPSVALWLIPHADNTAQDLLHDPVNSGLVDFSDDGQGRFKITFTKKSKIQGRLVSFGRPHERHDIVLPSKGFSSTEHCYFDVNPMSRAIMLHDVSKKRQTGLFHHVPEPEGGYKLSPDELNNPLSIRTCVVLPNQQYTFEIGKMKFLLIAPARSDMELRKFVDTVPKDYKTIRATTYAITETNKGTEGPSNPQTSPRLHSAHATIRHRPDHFLGSGGEAVVYQYLNLQDGNFYACKIISLSKDAPEVPGQGQKANEGYAAALKKRVAEEVTALSKMRHDNVISYNYTQGWDSNHELRIFMPRYETTLREMLPDYDRRTRSDWRLRVDRMISDVGSALKYIHGKGCFHRDIKPDNILANGQSFCVTDFGMARFPTSTGPLPVNRGHTRQYAAPEVLREGRETSAVDIFSFGVMILECLAYLPLVASPGSHDTRGVAERTLDVYPKYRLRLGLEWPEAESMISDRPARRPGASHIYKALLESGGVPMPGNARRGKSGREPRYPSRRLAPERRLGTPGTGEQKPATNARWPMLRRWNRQHSFPIRSPTRMRWSGLRPYRTDPPRSNSRRSNSLRSNSLRRCEHARQEMRNGN
ncbi:unnamed protein product [Clonostachys solani]|uniref:Protein kinase domain-containing protein n=1 Tax=Clonostachys solani TaxID=160281 RepID=A0A9P0EF25_9HYPO|nr:unnamed protein product [Clonostachys solani]